MSKRGRGMKASLTFAYSKSSVFFSLVWIIMYWTNVGRMAEGGGAWLKPPLMSRRDYGWRVCILKTPSHTPSLLLFFFPLSASHLKKSLSRASVCSAMSPWKTWGYTPAVDGSVPSGHHFFAGKERMLPKIMDAINGLYPCFLSWSFRPYLQPLRFLCIFLGVSGFSA